MDQLLIAAASTDYTWIFGLLKALAGLGFVIFVHELGHFLVAKACGVKCEKFYVGFDIPIKLGWGKWGIPLPASLWKKQWGETLYGIGIVPLGGYVKMLGQDDNPAKYREMQEKAKLAKEQEAQGDSAVASDETAAAAPDATVSADTAAATDKTAGEGGEEDFVLDPRSYMAKSVPQRMAIISAGVIMNLIFAVNFAALAYYLGVPYTQVIIGRTVSGSPASEANLPLGGKIVQITREGRKSEHLRFGMDFSQTVALWDEGKAIPILIRDRSGEEKWYEVVPDIVEIEGEGKISRLGFAPIASTQLSPKNPVPTSYPVPTSDASEPFAPLDIIEAIKVNGQTLSIKDFIDLQAALAGHVDDKLTFVLKREVTSDNASQNTAAESKGPVYKTVESEVGTRARRRFDFQVKMGPVTSIRKGSPAEKAKLEPGHLIKAVNGKPVADPLVLDDQLRRLAGTEVKLTVEKDGTETELAITPALPDRYTVDFSYDLPVGLESIGAAFAIEDVVASAGNDCPLEPGDKLIAAQFVGGSDETKKLLRKREQDEAIDLTKRANNWLAVDLAIQFLPADTKVKVKRQRGSETEVVELTPNSSTEYSLASRGLALKRAEEIRVADGWGEAYALGFRQTKEDALRVFVFLRKLVTGRVSPKMLGGPFTIAAVATSEASRDFSRLLMFLTLLSANLAVINFLPIPVLDGGHMVFLGLEAIFRRPVSERVVIPLTYLGLFLILGLMIFVFSRDIDRFFIR